MPEFVADTSMQCQSCGRHGAGRCAKVVRLPAISIKSNPLTPVRQLPIAEIFLCESCFERETNVPRYGPSRLDELRFSPALSL